VVTLTSLAEEYFQEVEAPTKGLALIKDAGHFAAFTQPERFLAELRTLVRPLASAATLSSTRKA
jgi:pimeloyl-ACP methyl ester carboxylesterase